MSHAKHLLSPKDFIFILERHDFIQEQHYFRFGTSLFTKERVYLVFTQKAWIREKGNKLGGIEGLISCIKKKIKS